MERRDPTQKALVLAGGGARGSYQVGVWRALMELDWHPQIITGTSVGGLNGAMFVLDRYETARDMWLTIRSRDVMELPEENADLSALHQFLRRVVKEGGMDVTPLEEIVERVLDDQAIPHPRLEVVLTTDEEIGMLGAEALDAAPLRGRKLINVDSEEEGIFTVSCAGGSMAQCTLPVTRAPYGGAALEVTVRGLAGGHSGTEIHKGRANACVLLGRLLQAMAEQTELRLVTAAGGGKDNAIAVEASAQVVVSDDAVARQAAEALAADLSREYAAADPGLRVEAAPCTVRETPMDWASTERAVCMLTCLPNGVQAMSMEIHGLVQTSLNLGILAADQTALTATFCVRSSLGSQKEMLHRRLRTLMAQLGGTVSISGDYPAWEYRQDSSLRDLMTEVFQEQYGRKPKIEAIHAGVECGILSGKLPGLDCVSIGPNLLDIHTPRERMEIASVQRVWRFVLEVLKRSK